MTRHTKCANKIVREVIICTALFISTASAYGQVNPAEIASPKLKATEAKYMEQIQSLHQTIEQTKFPFPLVLARYVNADPARETSFDSRGIEFVTFQNRTVLKISGIYSAAYNSNQLTQNERVGRTFQEVVVPILRLVTEQFPSDLDCDDIGFEIVYHTRGPKKNYDYEGREIIVVVLHKSDAFDYLAGTPDEKRQAILNRSGIYVNGEDFGLMLNGRDPLDVEALDRSAVGHDVAQTDSSSSRTATLTHSGVSNRSFVPTSSTETARIDLAERVNVSTPSPVVTPIVPAPKDSSPVAPKADLAPGPTPGDADHLQGEFQSQLDALLKADSAKFHFVDYAPPVFAVYHKKLVLQLTLRNPALFERSASSIYKRAAQSFDLFLAPELKGLMQKLPVSAELDALDITVLNRVGVEKNSSEAVEFICPLKPILTFLDDDITGQDLLNQCIILVNGIRISLNLQAVE